MLQFLGLKPGMHVLDLFGGNAYWAEIMAPVVGPKGHDTVWEPTQFYSDKTKASFAALMAKHPNVSIVSSPFEDPAASLPKNYADLVILNDNYHDTYWQNAKYKIPQMDPNAFLKAVYASMKPGAVIGSSTMLRTRTATLVPPSRSCTGSIPKSSRRTSSAPALCS